MFSNISNLLQLTVKFELVLLQKLKTASKVAHKSAKSYDQNASMEMSKVSVYVFCSGLRKLWRIKISVVHGADITKLTPGTSHNKNMLYLIQSELEPKWLQVHHALQFPNPPTLGDSRMAPSCASCKYTVCTAYDTLISGSFWEKRKRRLSLPHSSK